MAFDLSSITVSTPKNPPKIVLYADHGIGKSTFGASAPAPIFIRTEDGLGALQVPTFPLAQSFDDVVQALETLYVQPHPFQTCVVDTLDWLEPLVWRHAALLAGKEHIEDFGYGKGYKLADVQWRSILDGLRALNEEKQMTIICLAHVQIKRFNSPDTEPYDRYQMKLHDRAAALVSEWADVIGFAHLEVFTNTQDDGRGNKVTRGTGGQRRILSVEERPAYDAKNRYSLPSDLDFSKDRAWDAFAAACAPAFEAKPVAKLDLAVAKPVETAADRAQLDKVERVMGDEIRELNAQRAEEAARDAADDDDLNTDDDEELLQLQRDIREGAVVDA